MERFYEKVKSNLIFMPGFIARDNFGNNVTLGRGGSDFSASILASVLNAEKLEIWTDVSGIFTANPKIVKQSQQLIFYHTRKLWNYRVSELEFISKQLSLL